MKYMDKNVIFAGGYPAILVGGKVVRLHVLEMEKKLCRPLKKSECVHHVDKNKMNYHIDNLICFRSNSDHIAFHGGRKILFDDDGIAYCLDESYQKEKLRYKFCPICSNLMASSSKICIHCYKSAKAEYSARPDKKELLGLVKSGHTLIMIGKKFGVSSTAVKKWIKYYNIEFRSYPLKPDRELFVRDLQYMSVLNVSKKYNISKSTVQAWIQHFNIIYIPEKIQCVETGAVFNSMLEAADVLYPEFSRKFIGSFIGRIIDTNIDCHGYHWRRVNKQVI